MRSKDGLKGIDQRLVDAMLARSMQWTYQELRSQPKAFIDILQLMARQDAHKSNEDTAKAEARQKAQANKGGRR